MLISFKVKMTLHKFTLLRPNSVGAFTDGRAGCLVVLWWEFVCNFLRRPCNGTWVKVAWRRKQEKLGQFYCYPTWMGYQNAWRCVLRVCGATAQVNQSIFMPVFGVAESGWGFESKVNHRATHRFIFEAEAFGNGDGVSFYHQMEKGSNVQSYRQTLQWLNGFFVLDEMENFNRYWKMVKSRFSY